ncbi:MAG: flagellar basal body rod protein FlgB [Bdellovibrionales bacterium]
MSLFDKTVNGLQSSLSMRQLRHSITTSNIANAETPGYQAQKVDFEKALERAIDLEGAKIGLENKGAGGHIAQVRPDIYNDPDGEVNNDGNTVNIEKEMAMLSENALLYKAALQLINKKLAALKYAAGDGR